MGLHERLAAPLRARTSCLRLADLDRHKDIAAIAHCQRPGRSKPDQSYPPRGTEFDRPLGPLLSVANRVESAFSGGSDKA